MAMEGFSFLSRTWMGQGCAVPYRLQVLTRVCVCRARAGDMVCSCALRQRVTGGDVLVLPRGAACKCVAAMVAAMKGDAWSA